jgi:cytidylate kinase
MKKPTPHMIAIDGPAASGKTTLGKRLAEVLGYLFFDTGVMYRAVTWAALERGIDPDDEGAVTRLAEQLDIDVCKPSVNDGRTSDVLIDGVDITWDVFSPKVEQYVSIVAAYPGVRKALTVQQRKIGLRGQVVMVGRDIGTVVLPEAPLKIYLDASAEERARRRFSEQTSRGENISYAQVLEGIRSRDHIDSNRDTAPLEAASDAVIIQTDHMDAGEVMDCSLALVQKPN